jgi:hypothetical protein
MRGYETDDFGLAIYLSFVCTYQQVVVIVNGEFLLQWTYTQIALIFPKAYYWLQRCGWGGGLMLANDVMWRCLENVAMRS